MLNDDRADWREAWALFPGDVIYCWHAALHSAAFVASLEAAGFQIRSQIIWDKTRLIIGRGDYHLQHEPCLVCCPEGQDGPLGGRSEADHGLGDPAPEVADRAGVTKEIRDRIQNHALHDVSSKNYDRSNYMPGSAPA